MKQDLLRNIYWIARTWGTWKKYAHDAPLHLKFRKEVAWMRVELMVACAEFNVWYAHERMRRTA